MNNPEDRLKLIRRIKDYLHKYASDTQLLIVAKALGIAVTFKEIRSVDHE